jgi:hypothetical protein
VASADLAGGVGLQGLDDAQLLRSAIACSRASISGRDMHAFEGEANRRAGVLCERLMHLDGQMAVAPPGEWLSALREASAACKVLSQLCTRLQVQPMDLIERQVDVQATLLERIGTEDGLLNDLDPAQLAGLRQAATDLGCRRAADLVDQELARLAFAAVVGPVAVTAAKAHADPVARIALVNCVKVAAERFNMYGDVCQLHGLPATASLQITMQELRAAVEPALAPEVLRHLSQKQLGMLHAAGAVLGLGELQAAVVTENRRLNAAVVASADFIESLGGIASADDESLKSVCENIGRLEPVPDDMAAFGDEMLAELARRRHDSANGERLPVGSRRED